MTSRYFTAGLMCLGFAALWFKPSQSHLPMAKPITIPKPVLLVPDGHVNREIKIDGHPRGYWLKQGKKGADSLVIVLHGGGDVKAWNEAMRYGFSELSDSEGFHVAYPRSENGRWMYNPAAIQGYSDADFKFLREMARELRKELGFKRVYITGFSNGAVMAHEIAARYPKFASAIAPVCGTATVIGKPGIDTEPKAPVPVLMVVGKEDREMPFETVKPTVEMWRKASRGVAQVKLYVKEGGHVWPETLDGKDGTRVIWQFFAHNSGYGA